MISKEELVYQKFLFDFLFVYVLFKTSKKRKFGHILLNFFLQLV